MVFKGTSLPDVQCEKEQHGEDIQAPTRLPGPVTCCQMAQDMVDTAVAAARRYHARPILSYEALYGLE